MGRVGGISSAGGLYRLRNTTTCTMYWWLVNCTFLHLHDPRIGLRRYYSLPMICIHFYYTLKQNVKYDEKI